MTRYAMPRASKELSAAHRQTITEVSARLMRERGIKSVSVADLMAAAGLTHPQELRPVHFSQRTSTTHVQTFAQLYPALRPGELLEGTEDPRFRDAWRMARSDTFQPAL